MTDVFISYAREDISFVQVLHKRLAQADRDVWVDWEGIPPSAEWLAEIRAAIDSSDAFVFIISPDSTASTVCGEELAHAVAGHKRLVPIVYRDADPKDVPETLAKVNWLFFRDSDDVETAFATLIGALDTDLDHVHTHTRLLVRATEWGQRDRDASFTLRGGDLAAAEQWLAGVQDQEPRASPLQTEYVIASRRAVTRRQRVILAFAAVGLLVAVVLSLLAFFESQERVRQQASRLLAEGYEILDRDPSGALLRAHSADVLKPSEDTKTALEAGFRVLILQAQNRRESAQITGRGPGYLAGCWKEGTMFTTSSGDGRYTLLATERGESGATPPGDAYLFDNETLRSLKLESPKRVARRLEYAGFDQTDRQVFVTRYFDLAIYELDGSLLDTFAFSRFTKSPIHYVAGYIAKRFVVGGDCKGGLWLVDPKSGDTFELQRERHGDPIISATVAADGNHAALVFQSGRAVLLWFDANVPGPRQTEILSTGVLFAEAIVQPDGLTIVTSGRKGLLRTWRAVDGEVTPLKTYAHPKVDLDWVRFSDDGTRLIAVTRNHAASLLDRSSGELLAGFDYSEAIDWAAMKRLPRDAKPPPLSRRLEVAGRTWLATPRGALVEEDGRLIRITEPFHKVRDVVAVAGDTWILTGTTGPGATPGPAYRVDGYLTVEVDPSIGFVHQIVEFDDAAYFATSRGVFKREGDGPVPVSGIERSVAELAVTPGGLWALNRGILGAGPAWRIDGSGAVAMPDERSAVTDFLIAGGAVWLRTGWHGREGLAYRVRGSRVEIVPDRNHVVRSMQAVGDDVWLAALDSDGVHSAWRVRGERVEFVDLGGQGLIAVAAIGNSVWALATRGFFRVDGLHATRTPDKPVPGRRIVEHAGDVWLLAEDAAYRVRDERVAAFDTAHQVARDVSYAGGNTWLLSGETWDAGPAYRIEGDQALALCEGKWNVFSIVDVDGKVRVVLRVDGKFVTQEFDDTTPLSDPSNCGRVLQ